MWRIHAPENIRVLVWLILYDALPTNVLRHGRHMCSLSVCPRCADGNESLLHYFRDCSFSWGIWLNLGFTEPWFVQEQNIRCWIKRAAKEKYSAIFFAAIWWIWRWRNQVVFGEEICGQFKVLGAHL